MNSRNALANSFDEDAALKSDDQPEFNDALSYLDQVREHSKANYPKFLDLMSAHRAEILDTPEVIKCVKHPFFGNEVLILGFARFLPPGYHILPDPSHDPNFVWRFSSHLITPLHAIWLTDMVKVNRGAFLATVC